MFSKWIVANDITNRLTPFVRSMLENKTRFVEEVCEGALVVNDR